MERWIGRTALVSGAYIGIGGGISKALIKHGINVVGCARNLEKLKDFGAKLEGPGTFLPIQCDVSQEAEVLAMFKIAKEKFGGVDICINNAGVSYATSILEGKVEHWKSILDVHVLGLSICSREAVKSMKEKGIDDGHIINIGSVLGQFVPKAYHHYSAAKFALKALTEGTRNEICAAGKNFRVTELAPGIVQTDMPNRVHGPEFAKELHSSLRVLQPEDVADSVVYILSAPPHVQITKLMIETTDPWP